jgi:toxin FitB
MALLDTNALREFYTDRPNAGFTTWLGDRSLKDFYTTAINAGEIRYGIECLPDSHKKRRLAEWWDNYFLPNFEGRILSFDLKAAQIHSLIRAADKRKGAPRPLADGMIAAIALAHDFDLVTRNVKDFAGLDLELMNPWN